MCNNILTPPSDAVSAKAASADHVRGDFGAGGGGGGGGEGGGAPPAPPLSLFRFTAVLLSTVFLLL